MSRPTHEPRIAVACGIEGVADLVVRGRKGNIDPAALWPRRQGRRRLVEQDGESWGRAGTGHGADLLGGGVEVMRRVAVTGAPESSTERSQTVDIVDRGDVR